MVANSGNRKKIAAIVKELKCTAVESRNLTNWVGLKISLKVDPNVKMMGQVVGGIVIDTQYGSLPKKTLAQAKWTLKKSNSRESFVKAMKDNEEFMQKCRKFYHLQKGGLAT